MSRPVWPSTVDAYTNTPLLPNHVLQRAFRFTQSSGIVRTEMDAGYPKIRKRFTATLKTFPVTFTLTYEQYIVFEEFFMLPQSGSPLEGFKFGGIDQGSVVFDFPQPIWSPGDGETEDDRPLIPVRMVSSQGGDIYSLAPDGDSIEWILSFNLEQIPGVT